MSNSSVRGSTTLTALAGLDDEGVVVLGIGLLFTGSILGAIGWSPSGNTVVFGDRCSRLGSVPSDSARRTLDIVLVNVLSPSKRTGPRGDAECSASCGLGDELRDRDLVCLSSATLGFDPVGVHGTAFSMCVLPSMVATIMAFSMVMSSTKFATCSFSMSPPRVGVFG